MTFAASAEATREPAGCPACGGLRRGVVLEHCTDRLHGCPGEWSLLECEACGLVAISPMPGEEQIAALYPSNYPAYQSHRAAKSALRRLLGRVAVLPYARRFGDPERLERPFGGGRMLDIGCGVGMLLGKVVDMGWRATGVDASRVAVERAKRNVPAANILEGTLETCDLEAPFDWIVMNHVLEHLPFPIQTLEACFRLLAPGGILQIAVPNLQGVEATLFGRYWIGLDIPRHLLHFREPVLMRMLERCGYQIVSCRPQLFPSSLSESLLLLLPARLRRRVLGSALAKVLLLSSVFPAVLACRCGNRSVIEVRARKPPARA